MIICDICHSFSYETATICQQQSLVECHCCRLSAAVTVATLPRQCHALFGLAAERLTILGDEMDRYATVTRVSWQWRWQQWHFRDNVTTLHIVWQQSDWQSSVMWDGPACHCHEGQLTLTATAATLPWQCYAPFGIRVMDNPRWCQLYWRATVNCQHSHVTVLAEIPHLQLN